MNYRFELTEVFPVSVEADLPVRNPNTNSTGFCFCQGRKDNVAPRQLNDKFSEADVTQLLSNEDMVNMTPRFPRSFLGRPGGNMSVLGNYHPQERVKFALVEKFPVES